MKRLSFLLISLFPCLAVAEPTPEYTFAAVQYTSENLDDFDCTQDGIALSGSLLLVEDVFAVGSFRDVSGGGCGSSTLSLGAGYKFAFDLDYSLYATLSFADTSVDEGESDSGLVAAGGIRTFIAENLEANGEISHSTAFDGNTVVSGALLFWFNPDLAVTGNVGLGSESSTIAIGLRLNL